MSDNVLLSPLSDIVFKALFSREEKESKIILIDFINSILKLEGEECITEITYLNPFNIREFIGDKESILDLKVKTEKEERINIELQINKENDFRKRSLYYWANMYAETIAMAQSYTTLKKSIVINIMDFDIIEETDRYHTEFNILEKDEHFLLIEDLSIHYIELKKFDDQKDIQYMEAKELWLTFMKNAGKSGMEEYINKLIKRSEKIKMAKEMLEKVSADELLRQQYYAREKARLDAISSRVYVEERGMKKGMEKGMEIGIEKGMEKGIEKGIEKGKVEILTRQLKKKFKTLPEFFEKKLSEAEEGVIDKIAEDIFDIEDVKDLDKYLK